MSMRYLLVGRVHQEDLILVRDNGSELSLATSKATKHGAQLEQSSQERFLDGYDQARQLRPSSNPTIPRERLHT